MHPRPAGHTPSARHRFLAAGAGLALLFAAGTAGADGVISPGEIEAAKELISATVQPDVFDRQLERQKTRFRERLLKESANKGKEAAIDALFDDTVAPVLRQRYAAMLEARARVTAETHTPDQIRENIAFWQSDVGRAVMEVARDEKFGDSIMAGMRERLGMFDGLGLLNRLNDMGDAIVDAIAAKEGN